MRERNLSIDLMRGFSMFAMILIHTNAYFLHIPLAKTLWDYAQFAVPAFVFCSAYLFFKKPFDFSRIGEHIKKRVLRLLLPYYTFLLFFFAWIWYAEPYKLTPGYILANLTTTGGIDINWLIFLFLTFTLTIPLILLLEKYYKTIFYILTTLSIGSAALLLVYRPEIPYRYTMWLPWLSIVIFTLFVAKYEDKKWFFPVIIPATFLVFILLRHLQSLLDHSLLQYDNKYPPNLYHLSYGFFSVSLLYFLCKKRIFGLPGIKQLFLFLSKHSYTIYFVHYLLLLMFTTFTYKNDWKFSAVNFFAVILTTTLITQVTLNKTIYFFSTLKKAN